MLLQTIQRISRCICQPATRSLKPSLHCKYLFSNGLRLNNIRYSTQQICHNNISYSTQLCPTTNETRVERQWNIYHSESTTSYLISSGKKLIDKLSSRQKLASGEVKLLQDDLNRILGLLHNRKSPDLSQFYDELMKTNHAVSEGGYRIVMRHYALAGDAERVRKVFNLLAADKKNCGALRSRSYVPLVLVSLQLGQFENASRYLQEMITCAAGQRFNEHSFIEILTRCTDLLTEGNHSMLEKFIFEIFEELAPHDLSRRLVEDVICSWFENDLVHTWHITKTSVDKSDGRCKCCGKPLKEIPITSRRLDDLKKNLTGFIQSSILKKQNHSSVQVSGDIKSKYVPSRSRYSDDAYNNKLQNTNSKLQNINSKLQNTNTKVYSSGKHPSATTRKKSEIGIPNSSKVLANLERLKRFLDEHGPFDLVIDGLNCGYVSEGRFSTRLLERVVGAFIEHKRNILIMCGGQMTERLLTMKSSLLPHQLVLKETLLRLQKNNNCKLYFADSTAIDDYFFLYTLVAHDFDIELVSKDYLRDHMVHLEHAGSADTFRRWQRINQHTFNLTWEGVPVFEEPGMKYSASMQQCDEGSWHVPAAGKSWFCISKNKQHSTDYIEYIQ